MAHARYGRQEIYAVASCRNAGFHQRQRAAWQASPRPRPPAILRLLLLLPRLLLLAASVRVLPIRGCLLAILRLLAPIARLLLGVVG